MKQTKIYGKRKKKFKLLFLASILVIFVFLIFLAFDFSDESENTSFSGSLPVIVIETEGETLDHNAKTEDEIINDRSVNLRSKSQKYKAEFKLYSESPYKSKREISADLYTEIIINQRGQSSLKYPKKQYTVRFIDENGLENPQELLKMPQHDKWVLNGMYSDKSMMRNYIAYEMGAQTMEYSPRTRYVEVYLKTDQNQGEEEQYQGIYLLTEKIERDKNRVAIEKNDNKYKDSSFIAARDKIKAGDIVIQSDWNRLEEEYTIIPKNILKMRTLFTVNYPNKKNITDKDKENIIKSINNFEYALRSSNFNDKKEGYNKYIDIESFIKFALINEITKNIDGGEVSSFFHKDIGGKIKAGPVWDFDMSLGNTGVEEVDEAEGFLMVSTIWYDRLFQDDYFVEQYKRVYKRYRNSIWNDENINLLIDEALLELGPYIERNNKKWYPNDTMADYIDEVEELRSFLIARLRWMDKNINSVKRIRENVVE